VIFETDAFAAEYDRNGLPARHPLHHFDRGRRRRNHQLGLIVIARGRRHDETAIADCLVETFIKRRGLQDAIGSGRHHARLLVWPFLLRLDQPQARQSEIGHCARGRADVLAELRLDENDHGRRRLDPRLVLSVPAPGIVIRLSLWTGVAMIAGL
jgi:hypothetical protein